MLPTFRESSSDGAMTEVSLASQAVCEREADVEYLRHGEAGLLARLYRPAGPGPFAALVNVHGGAWTSGDRLNNEPTSRELAALGYVVMAIDFRMPPAAGYPGPVADVNYAIRWLKGHAAEYLVDPERVGGIGFSSGGHQLALNALRPGDPRYAALAGPPVQEHDASLAFLITCYGVLDPVSRYAMVRARHLEHLVASHHAYWPDEAAMAAGSPQRMVEQGEAQRLPPALIIQGDVDNNLTPEMADRFGAAYRAAGGQADVRRYPDAPHGFLRREPDSAAGVAARAVIAQFLARWAGHR
jgi:acetyl esterase